jgi:hypothetical protein
MEGIVICVYFMSVFLFPCLLLSFDFIPALIITYRSRILILSGVIAITIILALQTTLPKSSLNYAFLFTIPVLNSGFFLILRSLFRFFTGRYPFEYGIIFRIIRSKYGESYIFDHLFWLSNLFATLFIGFTICDLLNL